MAGKYVGPRRELVIKDSDLIWVARMLVGEGGRGIEQDEASAALWSMANRFLLHRKQESWPTFVSLLKAFSQPINPKWDGKAGNEPGNDFCAPGGKWEGSKFCTPDKLRRRESISSLTWEEIPAGVRRWVVEFQNGTLFPPDEIARLDRPRISNWAAKWLKKKRDGELKTLDRVYPWGVDFGGNWFFEDDGLLSGYVDVVSDHLSPSVKLEVPMALKVITGAAVAGAGYFGTKYVLSRKKNG